MQDKVGLFGMGMIFSILHFSKLHHDNPCRCQYQTAIFGINVPVTYQKKNWYKFSSDFVVWSMILMYMVYNNDDAVDRLTFSHSKYLQMGFLNWFNLFKSMDHSL